ncbi:MAG: hypothetical protein FVQ77_10920 [Cytophagales bacterium]|nr:hypothetical protein [Cytophagales bacterium]
METIQLQVPKEIAKLLNTSPVNKKSFILDAVKEKLGKIKNKNVDKLLVEGYKATSEEDLEITKDFEAIDFENLK